MDSAANPEPSTLPIPAEAASPSLARSATIIAIGNVVSRVLGLARETAIAYFFGASGQVSAFQAASTIPVMIYDLLVGGMLSAALVPVFSDYARPARRRELGAAAGAMLSVMAIVVAILVIVVELFAGPISRLVAGGFPDDLLALTEQLMRIMTPAVWFLAMGGVVTAILYSLKRFTIPAFAAAVYNLGIIVAALVLHQRLDITSLAVGVLLGAILQLAIQLPELRQAHVGLRPALRHPALPRIWRRYLPIVLGLAVSQVQVIIDRRLASGTGAQSLAWMRDATTLIQLPHGLIAVAISLAALPSLAQFYAAGDEYSFRRTLGRGLRMVLLLIVPATAGLWVLGEPIVQLIFQRGEFMSSDTAQVVLALHLYLLGLIPASVDWLLNYTFYARGDTLTPALVGIASVGIYLAVALLLLNPLGYLGLVLADSAKHMGHVLIMLVLLRRRLGSLQSLHAGVTLLKTSLAAAAMAAVLLVLTPLLGSRLPAGFEGNLIVVVAGAATGAVVYGAGVLLLQVDEAILLLNRLLRRRHPPANGTPA